MSEKTIEVPHLNIDTIRPLTEHTYEKEKSIGVRYMVIGRPGSGKTTVMSSILYAKKHIIPAVCVMNGSEELSPFYGKFVPDTFVHNEFKPEVIEGFMERQALAKQQPAIQAPMCALVIDDCSDDNTMFKKPIVQGLMKRGRHANGLIMYGLQYALDLPRAIRNSIDGVFLMQEDSPILRKICWESYAGVIPDFNTFCQLMDGVTGEYRALYIDKLSQSADWQDKVFYYCAKPPPSGWKFGCKDVWKFHKSRYDKAYRKF